MSMGSLDGAELGSFVADAPEGKLVGTTLGLGLTSGGCRFDGLVVMNFVGVSFFPLPRDAVGCCVSVNSISNTAVGCLDGHCVGLDVIGGYCVGLDVNSSPVSSISALATNPNLLGSVTVLS